MRRWQYVAGVVLFFAVLLVLLRPGHRAPPKPGAADGATASLAAAAAPPAAEEPVSPDFSFRHLVMNTAGDAPEACLRFSQRLLAAAEAHYADYLSITPSIHPAVTVRGEQLCLAGLGYGTEYAVKMLRGLPGSGGMRLAADETVQVSLGDREKLVDIAGDGFVLPRETAHGLTIQTVNVRQLKIHVLRMSEARVQQDVQTRQYVGQGADQRTQVYPYVLRSLLRDVAELVWSGTMVVADDHNRTVLTAFPLGSIIKPVMRGAFLVVAEDADKAMPGKVWKIGPVEEDENFPFTQSSAASAHWVIATDIALTTYSGSDGLLVSARSLASAAPLQGTRLTLVSTGQDVLGEAVTDAGGLAHFPAGLLRGLGAAAPGAVVAHGAGDDFTLLDLSKPAFDFSDRGVTGRPSPAPLQAFVYTERGIYRPGQNVEVVALLRGRRGEALKESPATFVLRRPDGMEAKRFPLAPQPAAGFHQTIPLSATAARGQWSVDVLADPAGPAIGHVSFDVQDFVPQQLKVTLAQGPAFLQAGEKLPIDVQGDYLYGAPAAGLHGEADLKIVRDMAPVPAAPGWSFGLIDEKVDDQTQNVTLPDADEHGHTHADADVQPKDMPQAPLKLQITAGLFDPAGRIVNDTREVKLRTQPILIGLHATFADNRTDIDRDAGIDVRVFDQAGNPVARPHLFWTVIREQQVYDWFQNGEFWRWHYHVEDQFVASGSLDAPADRPATLMRRFIDWGDYRLVVEDKETGVTSSMRVHAGWGETASDANIPDKVRVSADTDHVKPGSTVHVHIQGPFAGQAQIVVANDRVLETRNAEVAAGGTDIAVTQTPDWGAGAYVMVTMYRKLAGQTRAGAHDPVRAVGLVWLGTDALAHTLNVRIDTADQMRPQRTTAMKLHVDGVPAGESAYVTLAAVDEGILQLTRYATPDPVGYLFGKRALGVLMRDEYGSLLDGSADPGQIQGGDEGIGGAGLPVTSIRTVSLFTGPVAVDEAGNAQVQFQVPDFEGQLRLMAVAYADTAVGRAEKKLIVRDPVVADIAMPRFVGTGDHARLSVQLNDTDGEAGPYRMKIAVGGALHLDAGGSVVATLKPGARHVDAIEVDGAREGIGTIDADLAGPGGLQVHRAWQIAVRAPHYPITVQQTAWQKPGESFTADPGMLAAFVPGSMRLTLGYSAFGGIDVPSLMRGLWDYPYGCTEQLSSVASSLLYYGDKTLTGPRRLDPAEVHARVQDAIDTVLDRQGEDGVFGLWRVGDEQASAWLNIYALDFLLQAKEAGFVVPQSALQRSMTWLEQAAHGGFDRLRGRSYREDDISTRAYAAYLLARTGRADIGDLRRMNDTLLPRRVAKNTYWSVGNEFVVEPLALGHLSGALSFMGDRPRATDAMRRAITNLRYEDWPAWWFDWLYASPTRDEAALLAVASDAGDDAATGLLMHRLEDMKFSQEYLDTIDKASLLQAAHRLGKEAGAMPLSVNGANIQASTTPALDATPEAVAAGYTVVNSGDRPVWRTLSVTGAPLKAPPPMAAGYWITKQFFTLDGKDLDASHVRQNDRVIVVLHGGVTDDKTHRTVVVDMLPSGWEIEAPVTADTQYGFIGPLTETRVKEARDDRFVAAFDFGRDLVQWRDFDSNEANNDKPHLDDDEFRLAYVARAITPGNFTLPESVIQDMYRPAIMGRSDAAATNVAPR